MSNVKLAPTRILKVIPSDYCDIPYPTVAFQDSNAESRAGADGIIQNGNDPFQVQNSSGDWVNVVNPGDVIYFYEDNLAATVTEVLSPSDIRINAAILTEGEYYNLVIYQNSLFPNQGCQLYFPDPTVTLRIRFTSAGQDSAPGTNNGYVFGKVQSQVLPLQIVKLWESNTDIDVEYFAMW
jgi:hypothetical protein